MESKNKQTKDVAVQVTITDEEDEELEREFILLGESIDELVRTNKKENKVIGELVAVSRKLRERDEELRTQKELNEALKNRERERSMCTNRCTTEAQGKTTRQEKESERSKCKTQSKISISVSLFL